jgi:hypothetical protein
VLSALMEWPVDYMKPKLFIYIWKEQNETDSW